MHCRDVPRENQKPPQWKSDEQITAAASCPLTTGNHHAWAGDTKNYHVSLGDYCVFLILRLGSHQWVLRDERRNILSSGEYIVLLIATVDLGGWGQVSWAMKRIQSSHKLWKREALSCKGMWLTLSWPPLPWSADLLLTGQLLLARKVPPGHWLFALTRFQALRMRSSGRRRPGRGSPEMFIPSFCCVTLESPCAPCKTALQPRVLKSLC